MLKSLAEAGGKVIGGARFSLTSVLPGVLLVTIVAVVQRAGLYDLTARPDFAAVQPGRQDTATVILFIFFAFVFGVLLRPFEATIVQLLEGYWAVPSPLALLRGSAVERHRRRRAQALILLQYFEDLERTRQAPLASVRNRPAGRSASLHDLAERDRQWARWQRQADRARRTRSGYPTELRPDARTKGRDPHGELMPTALGNMLRRAERLSGDRYGLDMMRAYPRIHPFIAPRLENAVNQQLSLIAATASLSVTLGLTTVALLPLLLRWDVWSLLPLVPAALSVLAYRGAVAAAAFHGTLLSTVFDLHQFDLIKVFHFKVPEFADEMADTNELISEFLAQDTVRFDEHFPGEKLEHNPESEDPLHRANSNGPTQA